MITFQLNSDHDLQLTKNGQLELCNGIDALSQKIQQRLLLFLGEWFLDTTRGVPYFQSILGYGRNQSIATNLITSEIKKEDEVISVSSPSFSFDPKNRSYSYAATVLSEFGKKEVTINGYY